MKSLRGVALLASIMFALCDAYVVAQSDTSNVYASSVFKVSVWNKERPAVPLEGTAFLIATSKVRDKYTLYFLTAAHVILGPDGDDNTKLSDVVDRLEVRFGSAVGDVWNINLATIQTEIGWASHYRDFAIFKVVNASKPFTAIPINYSPSEESFVALGYPQGVETVIPLHGQILGDANPEPWLITSSPLSPGTSGAPVLDARGAFAIVEGSHKTAKDLRHIIPLRLAKIFIEQNVPVPLPVAPLANDPVSVSSLEKCYDGVWYEPPLELDELHPTVLIWKFSVNSNNILHVQRKDGFVSGDFVHGDGVWNGFLNWGDNTRWENVKLFDANSACDEIKTNQRWAYSRR